MQMIRSVYVLMMTVLVVLAQMPATAQEQDTVTIEMRHVAQVFSIDGCLSSAGSATFIISPPVQAALLPTEVVATTEEGTELRTRATWKLDAGGDMFTWEQYIPASVVDIRFVGGTAAVQARTTAHMWRGVHDVFQRTAEVRCFDFNFMPFLLTR